MKIAWMCLLGTVILWTASTAFGQQVEQLGQPGLETQQQNTNEQDSQTGQPPRFDAQQGSLGTQRPDLEPPATDAAQGAEQQPDAQSGANRQQQHTGHGQMDQGMAGEGVPGVLGVLIIESAGPGVTIREVIEGSAAAAAGLQPGDVILEINGEGVDSPPQVTQMIREIPAGQVATLNVWRDGQEQEIPATLQAAQRQQYRANYRGGSGSMNGDAAARIGRLESQLAAVLQELQQLRQEMMQLRASRAGAPSDATGIDTPLEPGATTQPGLEQPGAGLEQPGLEQPGLEEPTTQPGLEEQPAEPETTETEPALPF